MHACACHAFNATQVVGLRFAVLAPTPATIQNLQRYKDIMVVSQRPVVTTQAALDAMQPAAQETSAGEATLPPVSEENNGEAGGASPLGAEAGGASDNGEAGDASLESALDHERACGYERDLSDTPQATDQQET